MQQNEDSQFFNFLNFLRVVFASIVFFYHLSYPRYGLELNFIYKLALGHYAVAGFFFISGFFITRLLKSDLSSAGFIKGRGFRIYSVLLLCLVLTFFMDKIGSTLAPGLYSSDIYNSVGFPRQFFSTILLINQFWANHVRFGTNGPLWSLSYEVWYYALFFIFFRGGKLKIPALIVCLLIMGPKLWLLLPCYLLGCCFFCYRDRLPKIPAIWMSVILFLIAVEWTFAGKMLQIFLNNYSWHSLYHLRFSYDFAPDIFFTLLLFLICLVLYQNQHLLSRINNNVWKVSNHLAKRSYSFYLFHYPLLLLTFSVWSFVMGTQNSLTGLIVIAVATMISCYALGFFEVSMKKRKWK